MANYDDDDITLTFSYQEWGMISECIKSKRKYLHSKIETFLLSDDIAKHAEHIRGLQNKSKDLGELDDDIHYARRDSRVENAVARGVTL